MQIAQKMLLDLKNLNVYILKNVPGKIVINNQNNGLTVLTNDLVPVGEVNFLHNADISYVYQKRDGTELLVYWNNNGHDKRLVHVDVKHMTHTNIPIVGDINSFNLTPLFLWDSGICLLTSSKNMYTIDFSTMRMSEVPEVTVRENHSMFYHCWQKYNTPKIMLFDQKTFTVVERQEDQVKVIFIDPRHHHAAHPLVIEDGSSVVDVHYRDGVLLVVREKMIEL